MRLENYLLEQLDNMPVDKQRIQSGYAAVMYDRRVLRLGKNGFYRKNTGKILLAHYKFYDSLAHELHHAKNGFARLPTIGVRGTAVNEISAHGAEYLRRLSGLTFPEQKYHKCWINYDVKSFLNRDNPSFSYYARCRSLNGTNAIIYAEYLILPGYELNALADATISFGIDRWNISLRNGSYSGHILKQIDFCKQRELSQNYYDESTKEMFTYMINDEKINLLDLASRKVRASLLSTVNTTVRYANTLVDSR